MAERLIGVVIASLLALSASAAQGQERTEEQCKQLDPEISSPVEYATCTADLAGSTRLLNSAYAKLRMRVSAEYRLPLDKAQREWIAHWNAQCAYEAGGYGGNTAHSSDVIGCTAAMNRERAKYLTHEVVERWPGR